jgi:hypothetical protein
MEFEGGFPTALCPGRSGDLIISQGKRIASTGNSPRDTKTVCAQPVLAQLLQSRHKRHRPRSDPRSAAGKRKLPSLRDDERNLASIKSLQRVTSALLAALRCYAVLILGMLVENVLNDHLDADVLQIGIGRYVARVVAEGQVEAVPGRLQIVVPTIKARIRTAGRRAERRRRAEITVDVCRCGCVW